MVAEAETPGLTKSSDLGPAPSGSASLGAGTQPPAGKPAWQRFLESGGGAALITVTLGGFFGNWITATLQENRAENERRYLTHQEYLKERLATIEPTLERIGHTVAAAEDLITITRPDFSPDRFAAGAERGATLEKRRAVREAYNEADSLWRGEKDTLGYLLVYYHSGALEVSKAWEEAETAVTSFLHCARSWWVQHAEEPAEDAIEACNAERAAVEDTMETLIRASGRETAMEPRL